MLKTFFKRKPAVATPPAQPKPSLPQTAGPRTPTTALAEEFTIPLSIQDEFYRAQPAHIQRFLGVLHRIARDTFFVSDILRRGDTLPALEGEVGTVPIYCKDVEALFESVGADGKSTYRSYAYTQDLRSMDPNAQVHLSNFFGRILAVNTILTSTDPQLRAAKESVLPAMLDQILTDALFFQGFFRGFDLSTRLLRGKIAADEAGECFKALLLRTKADFEKAAPHLFNAARAFETLPSNTQQLGIELGKPYEDGQRTINGVYFDAAMAAKVMSRLAAAQGASNGQARSA